MKSLTLIVPDVVYFNATEEAAEQGVDLPSLCVAVLSDYFLSDESGEAPRRDASPPEPQPVSSTPISAPTFDVAAQFPEFRRTSIDLAQQFVDEAVKFPGVRAFRNHRGVGFNNNFVFIEYLRSRTGGLGVSFYGEPWKHTNPPSTMHKGRPGYSRAQISSQTELEQLLPHIRQSWELKEGKGYHP